MQAEIRAEPILADPYLISPSSYHTHRGALSSNTGITHEKVVWSAYFSLPIIFCEANANLRLTNKIVCGVKQRVIRLIMKYCELDKRLLTARLHSVYPAISGIELSRFVASAMGIVSHIDARVMIKKMDEFEY